MSVGTSKWDVVIIGSGISSLTCAALLAKKGKSVCVLEQYTKAGGYMHSFSRFGERFETGAHYVGAMGESQPFRALLEYLDVYDDKLFVPLDADGFDVFQFPDFRLQFPTGYDNVVHALSAQFPSEHTAIQKFFAEVRIAAMSFPTYEFNGALHNNIPLAMFDTSLAAFVRSLTSNKRLQCVLYSHCVLHGVSPEEVSFAFHAIMMDSLVRGPYGLGAGGDAITRKFVEQIEKAGGKVLTKKRVTQLVTRGKHLEEVITDTGESFTAEWVIAGIHPKAVFRLVSDTEVFSAAFKSRLNGLTESMGIFGVYAACTPEMPLNLRRNHYYFGSDDPDTFLEPKGPTSPGAIFVAPSRTLREGQKTIPVSLHAAGPIEWFEPWRGTAWGSRESEYQALKTQMAESLLDVVEKYEPGFRATVKKYVTSSPLTNLHFNGSEDGSSYGIYHSLQNTGARALGPRTHVLNLLLTGQNCVFPGLLGGAVSALRTAGHIVGIKSVLTELSDHMRGGRAEPVSVPPMSTAIKNERTLLA